MSNYKLSHLTIRDVKYLSIENKTEKQKKIRNFLTTEMDYARVTNTDY